MVTGAAGFVGSLLIERLLELRPGGARPRHRAAGPGAQPRGGEGPPELPLPAGRHPRSRARSEAFFRPEAGVLYHLASVVGVRRYMEDPLSLIDIAIIGTRHLIALSVEHDVRILFTSTSEVYGRNPAVPWSEDGDRVLGATSVDRWSYAASKGVCEQMLYGVHRKTGLPFSIVRFFNVYGPRQTPIYVVSQTVQRVLNGDAPRPLRRRRPDPLPHLRRRRHRGRASPRRPGRRRSARSSTSATPPRTPWPRWWQMVLDAAGSDLEPVAVDTSREIRCRLRGHRPARAGGGEGRADPRLEGRPPARRTASPGRWPGRARRPGTLR